MESKKIKILFLVVCTLQLLYLFYFRSNFKYEIIKNPFKENSGISYAIAAEVIESYDLLKKHKAKDFNLSKNLKIDTYFYQRSIEFNYPIRMKEDSRLTFFKLSEDIPNTCEFVENGKYLKLAHC